MAYGKKVEKNRIGYMFGTLFVLLAITYLVFNIIDGWRKYKESNRRLEASIASYAELTKQYEDLQKEKSLEQSTTGQEMQARSKFDLVKPEENVVFITSEEIPVVQPEEKGIKKMIHTFKNFFN